MPMQITARSSWKLADASSTSTTSTAMQPIAGIESTSASTRNISPNISAYAWWPSSRFRIFRHRKAHRTLARATSAMCSKLSRIASHKGQPVEAQKALATWTSYKGASAASLAGQFRGAQGSSRKEFIVADKMRVQHLLHMPQDRPLLRRPLQLHKLGVADGLAIQRLQLISIRVQLRQGLGIFAPRFQRDRITPPRTCRPAAPRHCRISAARLRLLPAGASSHTHKVATAKSTPLQPLASITHR